jgi:hypothetical protein
MYRNSALMRRDVPSKLTRPDLETIRDSDSCRMRQVNGADCNLCGFAPDAASYLGRERAIRKSAIQPSFAKTIDHNPQT